MQSAEDKIIVERRAFALHDTLAQHVQRLLRGDDQRERIGRVVDQGAQAGQEIARDLLTLHVALDDPLELVEQQGENDLPFPQRVQDRFEISRADAFLSRDGLDRRQQVGLFR